MPIPKAGLFSFHAIGSIGKGKKALMARVAAVPAPPPPPPECYEEQTVGSYGLNCYFNHYNKMGQLLTIPDRTVTKLAFKLRKLGNPAGDVTFAIWDWTAWKPIISKVLGDAADLPVDAEWIEVEFDDPVAIDTQACIYMQFEGGNSGNCVVFISRNSDIKPGEYLEYQNGALWDENYNDDAVYRYTYPCP